MAKRTPQPEAIEQGKAGACVRPRKPYSKPAIIHEQEVEASVGSPLGLPMDPLDPLGVMGTQR